MCRSQICNTIQNLSFYTIVSKQTCYFGVIACEVLFHVTAHLPYIKLLNEGNNKKDNPIGVSKVWFAGMQGVSHPLVYMSLPQQNFSFLMRTSTHRDTKRHTPLVLHSIYSTQRHSNLKLDFHQRWHHIQRDYLDVFHFHGPKKHHCFRMKTM